MSDCYGGPNCCHRAVSGYPDGQTLSGRPLHAMLYLPFNERRMLVKEQVNGIYYP